ncbi:hypothetical protein ZIOFF_026115 [Zingiber officinale]|uniref:ABC transporter C family member 3 n=1 Tax=Zingiber officinale TaxID=94328 RepID=A0A8J5LEJ9_ZINOF|nr:hypothetical protein ZIOFF_026115 [Zingiber officinale]
MFLNFCGGSDLWSLYAYGDSFEKALAIFQDLQNPIYSIPGFISELVQTKVYLDRISAFLWLEDLQPNVVQKLQKAVRSVLQGMMVAVCGSVGSGKSSLLSCILGEVPKISGTIKLCGKEAYVSQSPWILSGSIQDNITFGNIMDANKYDRVLDVCSLKKDLEAMPFGERRINLSGGQKQRVQIARAIYHDADIYLFDDPFSAVDAHTGSHLFKCTSLLLMECLLGLLSEKTVVYVTHQVEFLPSADLILVLEDGRIAELGKYNEMLNSGTKFMELVGAHSNTLSVHNLIEQTSDASEGGSSTKSNASISQNKELPDEENNKSEEVMQKGPVQDEERVIGKVGFWVYWRYITMAYKGALVPLVLLAQILLHGFGIAKMFLLVYASTDQSRVDTSLPSSVGSFASSLIQLLGTIAVMSQVAWPVLIIIVPIVAACIWYQQYYIATARELSRLMGIYRAPIIQHFAESMSGSVSVRSFDKEKEFVNTNYNLTNDVSQLELHSAGATEWLGFRLQILSTLTFAFSLIFLICMPEGVIDSGTCFVQSTCYFVTWKIHVYVNRYIVRYGRGMPFILRVSLALFLEGKRLELLEEQAVANQRSYRQYFDPVMFKGTVRNNLDPLEECTDEEIWKALDYCQLGEEIRKKELNLNSKVMENSENWSVGQRQLVCLARVLLRKSKILVLDEATASVDTITDTVIQKTLRQQFSESTVITVAHCITSVIDSDIVLVLDNGYTTRYI